MLTPRKPLTHQDELNFPLTNLGYVLKISKSILQYHQSIHSMVSREEQTLQQKDYTREKVFTAKTTQRECRLRAYCIPEPHPSHEP